MSSSRVLQRLAKHLPFEIAAGLNGAFWVDSGERKWSKDDRAKRVARDTVYIVHNIFHFGMAVQLRKGSIFGGSFGGAPTTELSKS